MMNLQQQKTRILLLSALGISLLLALPRFIVLLYVKNSGGGNEYAIGANGLDFILKFVYTYCIALIFLWINTLRFRVAFQNVKLDFNKFYQRLLINILLSYGLHYIILCLNLHIPSVAANAKFYNFIFNITFTLEVLLCILVAEIYMLIIKNQEIRLRNESLQKLNAEATYETLKNQINPHFLFNSLNTIQSMIAVNPEGARVFVNNMSTVYRHILGSFKKPLITLQEEMEVLAAYIKMMNERHTGSLQVDINNDNHYAHFLLPPMSLQLLVENAIKHNIVSNKQPLQITIEVTNNQVCVNNRMQNKKKKEPSTGTGLYNLNQRYLFLCNKEISINAI
ncbi:sensor histidine kinase [Leadbetterella sp. DM7]|uniref:sensor histidine kinase n=1 Tax=Leadbetterella sp. DM7 TaxID=3235085 RepID=UPI00349EF486